MLGQEIDDDSDKMLGDYGPGENRYDEMKLSIVQAYYGNYFMSGIILINIMIINWLMI